MSEDGNGRANGRGIGKGAGATATGSANGSDGRTEAIAAPGSGDVHDGGDALGEAASRGRGRSFKAAVKWSYVMDVGRQAITLLVTFVLAGILGPSAYGVVAIATTYIALLQLLTTQGLQPALIQRPDLRRAHPEAAFCMILGASAVAALVTVPLSSWWADVNHTPELRLVVIALTLLLPLQSVKLVQEALLRREMNIRPLAVRTNVSVLAGGVAGIVAAFVLRNVWALVIQQVVTTLLDVTILWRFSTWRPHFRLERRAARDLLSFTAGSSLASFGTFLNARADVLITGVFFGPVAVGLYRFASRLVDTAISVTVTSLQGASLPELARHQSDPRRFADRLQVVMRASALLSLPLLGVLAGVADPLMETVGSKWDRAATPLMILCIMGAGRALTMLIGPTLQALGRVAQLATLSWVAVAISVGAFVAAGVALQNTPVAEQVVAMSWSRAALWGGLFVLINAVVLKRATQVRIASVARSAAPSALAGVAAVAVGMAVTSATDPVVAGVVQLGVTGVAASAVAGLTLYSTDAVVRSSLARNLAARGWGGYDVAAHAPGQARAAHERAIALGAAVAGAALRASEPPATPRVKLYQALARRGWGGFGAAKHAANDDPRPLEATRR